MVQINENVRTGKPGMVDIVIVGAGAAGMSAALFLVRARRSVILYDSGKQRISATPFIHEYIGFEWVTPGEYHGRGCREIEFYGGEIRRQKVIGIGQTSDGMFFVSTDTGSVIARSVVIATGLVDVLPEIPGLKEGWGKDIHICPCFTGYELHEKKLVVFGLRERLGQLSKFLTAWTSRVTVITEEGFDVHVATQLEAAGVQVLVDEVIALLRADGVLKTVLTRDGTRISCDAAFVAAPMRAASELAASICEVDGQGFAKTDASGRTSVEGLWVIGNASNPIAHLAHAVAAGVEAGPMITDYLIERGIAEKLAGR